MSGVGGAHFKGNPEETERKYQRARELQLTGMFLTAACKKAGISVTHYRKLMNKKGDVSIAGKGDRCQRFLNSLSM